MKRELSDAFKDITAAVESAPGFYKKVQARNAMERLKIAIEAGAFERTQKEFLAADLKALAEGKPVKTDLAKAVENRIALLKLEAEAAGSLLLDVQQDAIAKGKALELVINQTRELEEEALFKSDWREPDEDEIEEAVACAGSEVPSV